MLFPLVTQIGSLEWIDCIFSYTICLYGWQSEVKAITHQVHSGHLSCNITGILSHWILGIAFQMWRIIIKDYHGKNNILSQYMN